MRQKKKAEDSKLEPEEACVKCSKLQNGRYSSFEETETQSKQTTLSTLKSVLKRSASHKKEKLNKNPEKPVSKDVHIVSKKTKNRVQFDETQNKYFEADYVILIHEEDYDLDDYYDEGSPFDDEDDDSYDDGMGGPKICCSNPNCNNMISLTNYPEYGYSNNLVDFKYSRGDDKDRFDFSNHYYDVNYEEINQNLKKSSTNSTNRCENEKCQNCNNYFDFEVSKLNTCQDFSDQVTLSPPEGYKDGGGSQYCPHHGLQFHNCVGDTTKEGAASRSVEFQDGDKPSDEEEVEDVQDFEESDPPTLEDKITVNNKEETENNMQEEGKPEKPKQRFIVETITMTTVTERRIVREASDSNAEESSAENAGDLKGSGILKGGKFWRNSTEKSTGKTVNYTEMVNYKESNEGPNEVHETASFGEILESTDDKTPEEIPELNKTEFEEDYKEQKKLENEATSPESTEFTLTFKLGQHLLVANSLKPNSAMRQLFPSPRFLSPPPLEDNAEVETNKPVPPKQFLVTAESLRLFEEAKKSKILGNMNSEEPGQSFIAIMPPIPKNDDDLQNNRINKTIERNSLRRSLIKYSYEFRNKRLSEKKKNENSLEERIRQLTCDIDEEEQQEEKKNEEDDMPLRSSPQGEESKVCVNSLNAETKNLRLIDSASPLSSTTASSSNSTYRKLTDLFSRKANPTPVLEDINRNIKSETIQCDLVLNTPGVPNSQNLNPQGQRNPLGIMRNFPRTPLTAESKKQFLSPLAPLTACVNADDKERYRIIEGGDKLPGDDSSEYSLQDIDEGLRETEKKLGIQPDVIAETPQNETTSTDELATFAQQGARRIEKLKKRYSAADDKSDDDDDYGFNKRPVVKGIKQQTSTSESQQAAQSSGAVGCNTKPTVTTATTTAIHTSWPYYSQENIDPKLRNIHPIRQEEGGHYMVYGNPQEFRGYPTMGNANYMEYQAVGQQKINYVGQQKINYVGQPQPNLYSSTNTYYRCQPVRFGGSTYSELSNYQFRHPPHSPPPVRRVMNTPQPSPIPSEEGRPQSRVFANRASETYGYTLGNPDTRQKVGVPEVGLNGVTQTPAEEVRKNAETIFHRRTVPNTQNPCFQMKFSPINYHQGAVPTASIRFSASCSPHPVIDESNVIIERHYSTLPHPPGQNTVGVIRVGQGQQMIRVPVPYSSGTPVQVHLMAGRLGRCESPQRPSSPQGAAKVPMQPYNQYLIAKGTQTAQIQSVPKAVSNGAPLSEPTKTVDFEKQGKAIAEELQNRQKIALSRSLSQETNFPGKLLQSVTEPVNKMASQERGVPEGAASSSVQDSQPPVVESTTAGPPGNTIYYTMNV